MQHISLMVIIQEGLNVDQPVELSLKSDWCSVCLDTFAMPVAVEYYCLKPVPHYFFIP